MTAHLAFIERLPACVTGALLVACWWSPAVASAEISGPGFRVESIAGPTNFSAADDAACIKGETPAGCDSYQLVITNAGAQPTNGGPVIITDTLPHGVSAEQIFTEAQTLNKAGSFTCSLVPARCSFNGVMQPGDALIVQIFLHVEPSSPETVANEVTVSGGGVAAPQAASFNNTINAAEVQPGMTDFSLTLAGPRGTADTQAGDHPYESTAAFMFATRLRSDIASVPTYVKEQRLQDKIYSPLQGVKDVVVDLPPGLVGNVQEAAKCTEGELAPGNINGLIGTRCPPDSQVGTIMLDFGGELSMAASRSPSASVIYNMVPEHGYPAEFGFNANGHPIILYASAVPSSEAAGGYELRVASRGIIRLSINGVSLSFWGVPAEASHNDLRRSGSNYGAESGVDPVGFLTSPVDCSAGPMSALTMTDTWENPGRLTADEAPDLSDQAWRVLSTVVYSQITGCNLLQFNPDLQFTPQTTQADEPTGVTANLRVPQAAQVPPLLATPELENVTVTLPVGMSLSPSAADGLQACASQQIGLDSPDPGDCPDRSVLGTVQITTPLLPSPLQGQVYLAAPRCDPCSNDDAAQGRMFRIYLEAKGSGVVIKKEGTVFADPTTGQLTTVFTHNPQFPFSDLQLQFKGGLRAPLATPQSCGRFTTTSDMTPWSSPITPDATTTSIFDISWDGNDGRCPASLPLVPSFSAGTSNASAGQFSPLTVTFARQDREQDISRIQIKTPPGLLGTLSDVSLCGEPHADLGQCPEASRIGSMTVAAGAGQHPFYEKGALYLTGSYESAPFGLSIVVPTKAGPFDLGNVIVRARIEVDPRTAALTATTDSSGSFAIPQTLDGIPLRLRMANVTIDRPNFIFNPTSCAQKSIAGTVSGTQSTDARVSARFAVTGCRSLGFKPKFSASTSGKTNRATGASLDVTLRYPRAPFGSQANIRSVKVDLPKQLPSRLATLQHACPAATFEANPATCPAASRVGTAKATTPVLPVPLTGPAYFISHGGEAFPQLIAVLQGYGIRVDLVGDTFISKKGITSSTFRTLPDVPVGTFELRLPQGTKPALAAGGNLCKIASKLRMPTAFVAQNGLVIHESTPISVTGCPKHHIRKASLRSHKHRRRKAR